MQKHDKIQNSLSKRIMKMYFKSNYSRLMFMSIANPSRSCTEKTHKCFKNSKTAFLDLKVTLWLGSTKVNIFLPEARTCSMQNHLTFESLSFDMIDFRLRKSSLILCSKCQLPMRKIFLDLQLLILSLLVICDILIILT